MKVRAPPAKCLVYKFDVIPVAAFCRKEFEYKSFVDWRRVFHRGITSKHSVLPSTRQWSCSALRDVVGVKLDAAQHVEREADDADLMKLI